MSHLDKQKIEVIEKLRVLCQHCRSGEEHDCPISRLTAEIARLHGVPVTVNDKLWHVVFM
jgi:hypothetical protein